MSESKTVYIVQTGRPPTHFLAPHPSGYGFSWVRGKLGRHTAKRFSDQTEAERAARNVPWLRNARVRAVVASAIERNAFVIRADGNTRTYWLERNSKALTGYFWHLGAPGELVACRFASREEADTICARYPGRGGGNSEVVEISFLDD